MTEYNYPLMRDTLKLAREAHEGQLYGDKPYSYHYMAVLKVASMAGMTSADAAVIAITHDTIEDIAPEKRDEFVERLRATISDFAFSVVWAMSGFGHNRKTRVADWRKKISEFPEAMPFKTADRIVNLEHSLANNPGLYAMYMREDREFFWEEIASQCGNEALIARYKAATDR